MKLRNKLLLAIVPVLSAVSSARADTTMALPADLDASAMIAAATTTMGTVAAGGLAIYGGVIVGKKIIGYFRRTT